MSFIELELPAENLKINYSNDMNYNDIESFLSKIGYDNISMDTKVPIIKDSVIKVDIPAKPCEICPDIKSAVSNNHILCLDIFLKETTNLVKFVALDNVEMFKKYEAKIPLTHLSPISANIAKYLAEKHKMSVCSYLLLVSNIAAFATKDIKRISLIDSEFTIKWSTEPQYENGVKIIKLLFSKVDMESLHKGIYYSTARNCAQTFLSKLFSENIFPNHNSFEEVMKDYEKLYN